MITAVAKKKYGGNVTDFLEQHLPKEDGSGMADYAIKDVAALIEAGTLLKVEEGKIEKVEKEKKGCSVKDGGQGAVGGVFDFADSKSCNM